MPWEKPAELPELRRLLRDGWRHKVIRLLPENPSFPPIVLTDGDEGDVSVVAELVEALA